MADGKSAAEIFRSNRMWGLKELPLPDPVSYLPQTAGWSVVGVLFLLMLAYAGYRVWLRWKASQYRRDAVAELDEMMRDRARLGELPLLLRRAALIAGSRAEVAGLRGADWIAWLNRSAGSEVFGGEDAALLDALCYAPPVAESVDIPEAQRLIAAGRVWMRKHHAAV